MAESSSGVGLFKLAVTVLVLIGILAALAFFGIELTRRDVPASTAVTEDASMDSVAVPEFTSEIEQRLLESSGFDALVSYTGSSFEPSDITIRVGDTIRFTNNSGSNVRIVETQVVLQDRRCEEGDLDSCAYVAPSDFWEHTFDQAGEYSYRGAPTTAGGTIRVTR